jgi:putative tryptophan/tyrosine transport system substrate-binding protein
VWSIVTLTLSVLVTPDVAAAQPRGQIPLVGVLSPDTPEAASPAGHSLTAFRQGLRELGYVEGQTIRLAYRFAAWQWDRLPALAAELVQLQPDVIVTYTGAGVRAAQQATATIPIVVAIGPDLVDLGLVASLARPGGNITGQILRDPELAGKRFELLKDAVPTITHMAILVDPVSTLSTPYVSVTEAAAHALGVRLQRVDAGTPEAIDAALATIATSGANALMIQDSAMFSAQRQRILDFARTHRLPTVCGGRQYVEAGCLIAYSPSHVEMFRRAAVFVDKLLKGAKPADLPMELPNKLELFLNLQTAEGLGITLPPTLLSLADEVMK